MTDRGAPTDNDLTEGQLRDFARARFYNYTLRQLAPAYVELRDAREKNLSAEAQTARAARLRERLIRGAPLSHEGDGS